MKSVKPGRGPSGMSFLSDIGGIAFGVIWTLIAIVIASSGGFGVIGLLFPLFGVIFIIQGVVRAMYHYKNATGKDRYSVFDITEEAEERDPGRRWVKGGEPLDQPRQPPSPERGAGFCPYCGVKTQDGFRFCPKCGRELPR